MLSKFFCALLIGLTCCAQALSADPPELLVKAVKPGTVVNVDRIIEDGKVLVSVADAGKNPLFGLGGSDFIITQAGRTARVVAVQPIADILVVPRHIVLVLDNSDSMLQRKAVQPLLDAADELFKIVRPIDQVHLVVFDDRATIKMGGRDLHIRIFKASSANELKSYVTEVYNSGMTSSTVLFEGMLAGLDLIGRMPAGEAKFMVVFSDGEDLNSAFKPAEVLAAAKGLARFDAYTIDYMPGLAVDPFLAEFAGQNRGKTWKAASETNLVPIFQAVATKLNYYYVVNYIFPMKGNLTVSPASLTVEEYRAIDASPPAEPAAAGEAAAEPAKVTSLAASIDAKALTLRPIVDSAYGIESWKLAIANGFEKLATLSGKGLPAAETVVPLRSDRLQELGAAGDITVTMELHDRKGQTLVLTSPPVKVNFLQTRGSLAVTPAALTIEEIRTIDASPMLGHIYFAEGSSEIPAQYVRLAGPQETAAFDEQAFRDTLDKYTQMLNIVGKRLTDHPTATITLTGCNADSGKEKGKKKLSGQRAEAVKSYLQTVWSIAPERLRVEARNLPAMPSTSRLKEGQADNRRVEIHSDDPAILDLIRSTYLATRIDSSGLNLRTAIDAVHGIARWQVTVANSRGKLAELAGEGPPAAELTVPLRTGNLLDLAGGGDITVAMELQDRKGRKLELTNRPVKVNFIQTSQRLALKQDFRMQEKYALILFDFDSDAIDTRNQAIVNTIAARIRELPLATVAIVGHTDNLGKEAYNLKLSARRAEAVYKLLLAAYGEDPGERVRQSGVGPNDPLYDNTTSEARAFNRTVTITLDYLAGE
jgi:outer membrane protein OmpA-like peptidoglycan-associated protein